MSSGYAVPLGLGNAVLEALPRGARDALYAALEVVEHPEPGVLYERGRPIDFVYFPIDAVYSVIVELADGAAYEVDTLGRFGVAGAEVLIGAPASARTTLCQIGGRVARIRTADFLSVVNADARTKQPILDALRAQWFVSQQTVGCNASHTDIERCARWILMTHDQVGRTTFPMRSEYLSIMLGVSQLAAKAAVKILEDLGCVRYVGDEVTLVSRPRLREHACECYAVQNVNAVREPPADDRDAR